MGERLSLLVVELALLPRLPDPGRQLPAEREPLLDVPRVEAVGRGDAAAGVRPSLTSWTIASHSSAGCMSARTRLATRYAPAGG